MRNLLLLTFLGFFFISCTKERLEANGDIKTEIRQLRAFTGVTSSGSKRIHISYGQEYKVELRGSSNLLPRFKTEIYSNTLKVGYERVNVIDDDIEVFVTMPRLSNITLSGSGKVIINGDFPYQDYCNFRISGSGDVQVQDMFEAGNIDINISGSGSADMLKILAEEADVKISGSGDARISVDNYLNVKISGSGKVYYDGNPSIDSKISGSGDIIKL